ncbi:MAG: HlyD family efflux transporter periplasmic adaptor subunit, partial [Planctomycetota bacterium]
AMPFRVAKLRPTPEVRDGASPYIAEASIENTDGWLRPGMEGAAKIRIERRNVAWVYTRKLVAWLRMHLWW